MRARLRLVVGLAVVLCPAVPAHAAGPLRVNGAGQPVAWTAQPIAYNPDQGPLGTLSNTDALAFVSARLAPWSAVPTAAVSFTDAGALPVDATAANALSYFGVCGDGVSPIIFDTDGAIIRMLFGIGNENYVLGATTPECVTYTPPAITEAATILNGRFIDGVQTQLNPEISLVAFGAVATHEFGHFAGLDHSQVNLIEAFDKDAANDAAVATMFPILVNGAEQATLHLDDEVSLSMLYPAASFTGRGSIHGSVFRPDGIAPFQGAYVIARDVTNPRINAVGVASGFLFSATAPGGPPAAGLLGAYEIDGLEPGSSYTVEVESIDARFTGSSSVGPLDPPAVVQVSEFWNDTNEAATNPPDDPDEATPLMAIGGGPVTGIDIVLNTVSGTLPPNDSCDQATGVSSLPLGTSLDTTGATEGSADPNLVCGAGERHSNTVWYAITAPEDGLLTLDTCGSDYDTILSAFTGDCDALVPLTCNDDLAASVSGCGARASRTSFDVLAGQTYVVEIAQFGAPVGGQLHLNATITPRNCLGGTCLPGNGAPRHECMTEFLVEPPPTFRGRRAPSSITCHDGGACDADSDSTNHSCTFHVAVCLNNSDPTLACTPSDITTVELLTPKRNAMLNTPRDNDNADGLLASIATSGTGGTVRGICLNKPVSAFCDTNAECDTPGRNDGRCYVFVRFAPSMAETDRCGISARVVVPLTRQRNGSYRAGSKRIRVKVANRDHLVDRDTLTLRCRPSQ